MVAAPLRAFVRSRDGLDAPDLLLGWVPMLYEANPEPKISSQSGMTCYAHPMRPESQRVDSALRLPIQKFSPLSILIFFRLQSMRINQ